MRLLTIDRPPAGRTGAMIGNEVLDLGMAGDIHPLAAWIPAEMSALLAAGPQGLEVVKSVVRKVEDAGPLAHELLREQGALTPYSETRLLAPVPRPRLVFSHGAAYRSHSKEMAGDGPVHVRENPNGFIKNTNAVIGPGAAIRLPPQNPAMVDYEAEISVVFGKACHHVKREEAWNYVAGFTILNDISARDWIAVLRATGSDRLNLMGKQFPTFSPMGPWITTMDDIPDPLDMSLELKLNGQLMQEAHTSDLIWQIPELIEWYSTFFPFEPGDVMTSGTPAGVGFGRKPQVFLKPGDTVAITVSHVGTLENPVVAAL